MPKRMTTKAAKAEPITEKTRHANSVASFLPTAPGWSTQRAQLGGRPAVVIYRAGKRRKGYTLPGMTPLFDEVLQRLPAALQWRGVTNFAIIGQLRQGRFEALAISTLSGRQLVSYDCFSGSYIDTPQVRWLTNQHDEMRTHDAKRVVQHRHPVSTPVTVIMSLYKRKLVIQWVHREKQKLLFTLRFKRELARDVDTPKLNTRASKG